MEQADLRVVKDGHTTQSQSQAAVVALASSPIETALGPIVMPKGRRLDVDEILRRSLPKLSQPTS